MIIGSFGSFACSFLYSFYGDSDNFSNSPNTASIAVLIRAKPKDFIQYLLLMQLAFWEGSLNFEL